MPRTLTIAAVQMDANSAPTHIRLSRAQQLVEQAAAAGARLVALPELFNIGYEYSDGNHARAETADGPTLAWMRQTAARLGVHLAGSLLLLDGADIYNSLLLVAPDGRTWRYDKNYPWGWERGYFRGRRATVVADTDLGRLGMLICWDTAHRDLWQQYAGKIDAMLISSCPPDVTNPTYEFPSGSRLTIDQLGPLMAAIKDSGRRLFGDMINEQTTWLGVPTANTVGTGRITTAVPRGLATLLAIVPSAPWLLRYLPQAHRLRMSCDMIQGCKVVDAEGHVLAEMAQEQGEGFTAAEVVLADAPPQPRGAQPPSRVPAFAYLSSDIILPWLMEPIYRRGVRRAWGEHMAPSAKRMRLWAGAAGILVAFGMAVGLLARRRAARSIVA
ncbi:MAG: carbon-nitrogen hydrolase family protein [Roseiflexaceae bacterium]